MRKQTHGILQTVAYDYSQFDPRFAQAIMAFLAAGRAAGYSDLDILSGYRSVERQQQLWDEALARYGSEAAARQWVAPPGHSYHNMGLAADVGYAGGGLSGAPPDAVQWMHDNAANFGLVFPLDNEAWHIELAGARDPGGIPANATPNAQQNVAGRVSGAAGGPMPAAPAETPAEDPRAAAIADAFKAFGGGFGAPQGGEGGTGPVEMPSGPTTAVTGLENSRNRLAQMRDFLMPAPENVATSPNPQNQPQYWPFGQAAAAPMRPDPLQILFGAAKPAELPGGGARIRA